MARYLRIFEGRSGSTRAGSGQKTTGPWAGADSLAKWGAIYSQLTYVAVKMS